MTKPQFVPDQRARNTPHDRAGYAPYDLAGRFDQQLGDPGRRDLPFSAARLRELDAREEFPEGAVRQLDTLRMATYYVPEEHGGALRSYEDLIQLVRVVARRDLTAAIAHTKTYLGSVSTWVGGSPTQQADLGARVVAGTVVAWGLTEREHGSDLLSGGLTATPTADGYRLDGEKWLINNATRGELVCVLARATPEGGARGFSLLLVDKKQLAPGTYMCLPAARTLGIRGADISGISFDGAEIPAAALIGAPGQGVEIVLRSLQITRTLCTALSLGAVDRALRIAVRFGLGHQLYEHRLIDLPQARRTLTETYADLLVMEAVTLIASRGVHTLTEEMSVTSSVAKYLVPSTGDELIRGLGQLLGARSYLSEEFAHGLFPKLERDHQIVGVFDGNTLVNLNALINQFGTLAKGYRAGRTNVDGLARAAELTAGLPEFDPTRLVLTSRTGNSVTASLPDSVDELRKAAESGEVPQSLLALAGAVHRIADETHELMAAHRPTPRDVPAFAFDLAQRYTLCAAAAACLQLWLRNRDSAPRGTSASDELWQNGLWLEACLSRIVTRLRPGVLADAPHNGDAAGGEDALDRLMTPLLSQYETDHMFSLLPFPLSAESVESLEAS
ncbi:acyl-CoA dehydrogenase family protein [Streptomyces antimycoticus]